MQTFPTLLMTAHHSCSNLSPCPPPSGTDACLWRNFRRYTNGEVTFKLNLQLSDLSLNVTSLKVHPLITVTTDSFNPQTPNLH